MRLTHRQKHVISALLDLYREAKAPIPYARLAERLGVSLPTAYQMLRLLEQKGLVRAEYGPTHGGFGAGRAPVLFAPTETADRLIAELAGDAHGDQEWHATKARILAGLESGKAPAYEVLLRDLLARIPETRSPLALAAEILTALLLTLHERRIELDERGPLRLLLRGPATRLGLSMLAGTALGLSWADRTNRRLLSGFREQMERYETAVQELSNEGLAELREFARDVTAALANRR